MIPKFYIQPWTQDIKNREIIVHVIITTQNIWTQVFFFIKV